MVFTLWVFLNMGLVLGLIVGFSSFLSVLGWKSCLWNFLICLRKQQVVFFGAPRFSDGHTHTHTQRFAPQDNLRLSSFGCLKGQGMEHHVKRPSGGDGRLKPNTVSTFTSSFLTHTLPMFPLNATGRAQRLTDCLRISSKFSFDKHKEQNPDTRTKLFHPPPPTRS